MLWTLRAAWLKVTRQLTLAVTFVNNDIWKTKGPYLVGLSTVVIMVFLTTTILVGSGVMPGLFVRLAEDQSGELDVLLLANKDTGAPFLNRCDIPERTGWCSHLQGMLGMLESYWQCCVDMNLPPRYLPFTPPPRHHPPASSTSLQLLPISPGALSLLPLHPSTVHIPLP